MPPMAPDIPAMPTTEPIAPRGNMSDASVNMLHDQPWCAAAARLISATACHSDVAFETSAIGVTSTAHVNIAVLRAAFTLQPPAIRRDDSQPPKMLPMSEAR